ncbi:hypothetical protein [Pseudoroseicyclus tamaricis]|uniref:Lipoprotein n=1 Tax=Pseudoroseicyclus tamaricis TaxID=2705421 RepID=A0A6B2JPS7_9RHOB|nr:hypothetical protein [Pseudoroseicyclus tamaricis]NDU99964.1 hypothetical protein [Pseudoroseicyclus tamaricis]
MSRLALAALCALPILAACGPSLPPDPEEVAQYCEARARAATGPTGEARLGVNSNSGPSVGLSIGLSSDYIAGRDPLEVYNECVWQRTGAAPIRPPRL